MPSSRALPSAGNYARSSGLHEMRKQEAARQRDRILPNQRLRLVPFERPSP
jgi:hypothetical protein